MRPAKSPILGYIVIHEDFEEPLELCVYKGYPDKILLRADIATAFETEDEAMSAIDKTLEWANVRQEEDESLKPLMWADKRKYSIWAVRKNTNRN